MPVPEAGQPKPQRRSALFRRLNRMEEAPFGVILILPTALLLLLVNWLPIGYAIRTSMQKVQLTISPKRPFIGLDNYRKILNDDLVWDALIRTLGFSAITILTCTTISIITALTLNEQFPGRSVSRVLLLLPWAVASLVTGVMWRYLFNGKFGVVNAILMKLGLIDEYIDFLGNSRRALIIAGIATAWKLTPFVSLLLLAGMQSIPDALYRSAKMDGANVWTRFRVITAPHLRMVFAVCLVNQIVAALLAFDLIYGFTKGGPGYGTTVLNYLIFIEAFERLDLGVASAMSMLMTLLIVAVSGLSLLFVMRGRQK